MRVTRIDQPEAMLVAPEQAFFLQREPQAAPAQRAAGAAGAPVRHRAGRPALARRPRSSATSTAARGARSSRSSCCARSRSRRARSACRGPTTRCAALAAAVARRAERPNAMRLAIWFVLLFAVAVVAATTLGTNDGLVELLLGRLAARPVAEPVPAAAGRHLLPARRRDPGDQLAGRPAAARARMARRAARPQRRRRRCARRWRSTSAAATRRAQKSAQRALAIQAETPELAQDNEFTVLGHLLAAGSAHRLQDRARARRGAAPRARPRRTAAPAARSAEEGARLLAAEWALDDRDAPRALELLDELPLGVARRTHALRLKLQAARLGAPAAGGAEDGAPAGQAPGLLDGRRRRACCARWPSSRSTRRTTSISCAASGSRSTPADRRDPFVAARAATQRQRARRATRTRAPGCGRSGTALAELGAEERAAIAEALAGACRGIGAEWLPRLEAAAQALPRDGAVALAAGSALAERGLWGKARRAARAGRGRRPCSPRRRAARPGSRWPSWPRRRATRRAPRAATRAAARPG